MADNITLNAGSGGATLATDDIGGVQYQRVKQAFGADGTATDVTATTPLPVAGQGSAQSITITAGSGTRTFGPIDLLGYSSWLGQWSTIGAAAGTPALQVSSDGTNWISVAKYEVYDTGQMYLQSGTQFSNWVASTYLFAGAAYYRYLRIQTSGTVTGTHVFTVIANPETSRPAFQPAVGSGTSAPTDGWNLGSQVPIAATVAQYGYIGGASSQWDRARIPNIVKTVAATASGDTAVWTPTSGRKFRLMRYKITVTGSAAVASAGDITIAFRDATTATAVTETAYLPAASAAVLGSWSSGWVDLGNGILSAAANNVLNINLSAALTSGAVRVLVCGTEE